MKSRNIPESAKTPFVAGFGRLVIRYIILKEINPVVNSKNQQRNVIWILVVVLFRRYFLDSSDRFSAMLLSDLDNIYLSLHVI